MPAAASSPTASTASSTRASTGGTDAGATTSYTTNNLNQYTEVGDTTFGFDPDGNLISKTEEGVTTTYTYDTENRLVGVSTPTDIWTYRYDAFGNRVEATQRVRRAARPAVAHADLDGVARQAEAGDAQAERVVAPPRGQR